MKPKKKATFKFYLVDGGMPYFGGYKAGSMTEGEPQLFFNCEAVMQQIKDEPKNEMAVSFKDIMLSTLTHEFCHAMQEWLNMEFDELQVEKILGAYNEKWNVFNAEGNMEEEDEEAVFKINDMLRFLDNEPESELKEKILNLFNAHDLWRKAHEQHAIENPPTPLQPSGTGEEDELIEAMKKTTEKACESPESALKYLKHLGFEREDEEGEKEVTASHFYQVCTCPESKDTCPIHGKPLMGTVTTSSTEMISFPSAGHREHEEREQALNWQIEKDHGLKEGSVIETAPYKGHRDSKEDNSEEEKVTPEEIKAIAETSLILYIRKLQEVNANAIQKIAEELGNKATLKQTIAQQEQTIKELKNWKESAMSVWPDMQEIGKLIGVKLGHSIHDKIIPYLKEQEQRIKDLEKQLQLEHK